MARIAVDVTPLLPGGINGGAKPMVIALLQELPRILDDDEFVLLTADYSHDELAFLERHNLRRVCVHHNSISGEPGRLPISKNFIKKVQALFLGWLPTKFKWWLRDLYYRLRPPSSSVPDIKQTDFDFLFCPFSAPNFYQPGIPTLSIVYDLQFLDYPNFFTESERFYRQLHFDKICQLSDHVVTISEFTKQSVLENSALISEQVTTIHIGLIRDYTAQPDASKKQKFFEQLSVSPKHYLFYPANFWKHKNHRALFKAFQHFRQKFPTADMKIVCTGALDDRRTVLLAEIKKMGLEQDVLMPGFLPDNQIDFIYQGAKGLIFPSLYEGFGIPLLEAMAAGIPVACSSVTSLPEIGGDAVFYFTPTSIEEISQAIEALVFDDRLCNELMQKGKKRLAIFGDASTMAQKYADLIHQILRTRTKIYTYYLRGLTDDGWFQKSAYLALPETSQKRYLDLSICVPDWMPDGQKLSFLQEDQLVAELTCSRGQTMTETLELPISSGMIELRFAKNFSPTVMGFGDDNRLLSASCDKFQIRSEGVVVFSPLS